MLINVFTDWFTCLLTYNHWAPQATIRPSLDSVHHLQSAMFAILAEFAGSVEHLQLSQVH